METPMTVTGDKAKLMTLHHALTNHNAYLFKMKERFPESYKDTLEWIGVVDQAIKDLEFEQSINPLPFK